MATAPYTVVPGDTLYGVSKRFNMSVDDIRSINNLSSDALSVGQVIQINVPSGSLPTPPPPSPPPPPRPSTPPPASPSATGSSAYTTYSVQAGDSLYKISQKFGVSVDAILSANGLQSNNLTVGQQLRIPTSGGGSTPPPPPTPSQPNPPKPPSPPPASGGGTVYTVQAGDSLYKIGQQFGVSPESIMQANSLASPALSVGQQLRIPGSSGGSTPPPQPPPPTLKPPAPGPTQPGSGGYTMYTVAPGDSLYRIGQQFGVSPEAILQANNLSSPALSVGQQLRIPGGSGGSTTPPPPPPVVQPPRPPIGTTPPSGSGSTEYTVQPGDSLYRIGQKFGVSPEAILQANDMTSPALSVGQVLLIPGAGGGTGPVAPPQPPPPVNPGTPPPPPTGSGSHMVARQEFKLETTRDNASNCNRYKLTVRLPNGQTVVAQMRDNNSNSAHMVYPNGVMYGGQSSIQLDVNSITSIGLSLTHAKSLQYVSAHEGKYDAINGYDKAVFSYGCIQFVGKQEFGASLNNLLSSMRSNAGSAFEKIFGRVGIGCEGNTVTVLDENGRKLTNDQAWLYIQKDVRLCGPFIQAGFEPSLVLEQLRQANALYVQPSLKRAIDVNGLQLPLGNFILTEGLVTAVIAIAVSRGVGGMAKIMSESCSRVAAQQGLRDAASLPRIDERIVCQDIANNPTNDKRVRDRAQGVLNDGLSFAK